MSEVIYTYSVATDFHGNINSILLQQTIQSDTTGTASTTSFAAVIQRIDVTGDVVDIVFNQALTSDELILLNSLIAAHNGIPPIVYQLLGKLVPSPTFMNEPSYIRQDSFIYDGSSYTSAISRLLSYSYMDAGSTSYSLMLVDATNNVVLGSQSFTNTTEDLVEMTSFDNIPGQQAVIELYVKQNGADTSLYTYISSVSVYGSQI